MKKYTLLFLFFIFYFSANAQIENSLLWEISGKNLKQPSYIYGTIHLVPEDDFFFYDYWLEKLFASDILVLETDINLSFTEQLSLVDKIKLPDKKTIEDYMSQEDFLSMKSYLLDTLEVSKTTYKFCLTGKPFFVASLIYNDVIEGNKISYEQYLSKKAKKRKIKILGLETIDFQFSLVDSISIEEQIKMFLFDPEKEKQKDIVEEFNTLSKYYKKQDLNTIEELTYNEADAFFVQNFVIKRNMDWIPKIKGILNKKTAFIAVGAAHLPGEYGIINLLKKEGYTVKPVTKE